MAPNRLTGVYPMVATVPTGAMIAWTNGAQTSSAIELLRVQ